MKPDLRAILTGTIALFFVISIVEISGGQSALASSPSGMDSQLIVKNNIRRVKAYSETEVPRDRRNSFDSPENVPMETEYHTTWTEYDKVGRIIVVVDSATISDSQGLTVSEDTFQYSGNALVAHSFRKRIESGKNNPQRKVVQIDITKWNREYTGHHSEQEESGQWNVQIDSTVFNRDGKKRITYSYNSMGDSFVEEFTYDAKARLKYRRLAMKQFWSPPWELESSTYNYSDDGSWSVIDSSWRNNPDLNVACKHAGDVHASDYDWKVLMAAPGTGTFDRLETRKESWYDSRDSLTRYQLWEQYAYMWEDYSWVYDKTGKLMLHTEYRGDKPEDRNGVYGTPCTDSVWCEYKFGRLYREWSKHFCNGYASATNDTFEENPDRITRSAYYGSIVGGVEAVSEFRHDRGVDYYIADARGLPIERRVRNFFGELTVIEYTYFTW